MCVDVMYKCPQEGRETRRRKRNDLIPGVRERTLGRVRTQRDIGGEREGPELAQDSYKISLSLYTPTLKLYLCYTCT